MVTFNGQRVTIKKIKRRCVGIRLHRNGQLVVSAYYQYSEEVIQDILDRHKRFFSNSIERQRKRLSVSYPNLKDGGKVRILGKKYVVVRNSGIKTAHIELDKLYLPLKFPQNQAKKFFSDILYPYVSRLTKLYIKNRNLKCTSIGLYSRITAWGSYYSKDGSIKYNLGLVFVPKRCIRYVVVHELCHSRQLNHSKQFWKEVENTMPNYKEAENKLDSYDLSRLLIRSNLKKDKNAGGCYEKQ